MTAPPTVPLDRPVRLACLISGGGRTALNLHEKIAAGELDAEIVAVLADRPCTGARRCEAAGLPVTRATRRTAADAANRLFTETGADLMLLCGFLSKLPIGDRLAGRVMNIHPSLLPAFGGPGMYGDRVHRAALERGVKVSGCTVHLVTDEYDAGPIVLQRAVPVESTDDPATLATRVFEAEREALPEAVRLWAGGRLRVEGRRVLIDQPRARASGVTGTP